MATEFINCPECGRGVSLITNPTTCYYCKRLVYSEHPEMYETRDEAPGSEHYRAGPGPQPIELTRHMGFLDGNVVKYVCRFRHKNGLDDLLKARQYLDWLIEKEYPGEDA